MDCVSPPVIAILCIQFLAVLSLHYDVADLTQFCVGNFSHDFLTAFNSEWPPQAIIIKLSQESYLQIAECNVSVHAVDGSKLGLLVEKMIHGDHLNIHDDVDCQKHGYLQIKHQNGRREDSIEKVCGEWDLTLEKSNTSRRAFISHNGNFQVRVRDFHEPSSFQVVIMPIREPNETGLCSPGSTSCCRECFGRPVCINEDLQCDHNFHCFPGNWEESSACSKKKEKENLIMIIGIIFGVIFVGLMGSCTVYTVRSQRKNQPHLNPEFASSPSRDYQTMSSRQRSRNSNSITVSSEPPAIVITTAPRVNQSNASLVLDLPPSYEEATSLS